MGHGRSFAPVPPGRKCAPLWHPQLRRHLPNLRLALVIGAYVQAFYFGRARKRSLTETVRAHHEMLADTFPLPHPSPRNRRWLRDRPWFERDVIPAMRATFRAAMD
ncbi:MAG: hypothetical protein EXR39_10030 [Betaproteobacteria bacterium]|nr:hypothetical protein [Betaproteobacteria bacterium]